MPLLVYVIILVKTFGLFVDFNADMNNNALNPLKDKISCVPAFNFLLCLEFI